MCSQIIIYMSAAQVQHPNIIRPNIWDYRDARALVRDICAYKQASEKHFSFRKIARFADLASPGYIQTFINGKRNLKLATAERLAEALGLSRAEIDYFLVLLQFTQAETPDEKTGFYEQLLRHSMRQGTGRVDAARLAYFTEWYIPVVHAMASLKGFQADPAWIGRRMVPRIRPAEAQKALDTLLQLSLIEIDARGRCRVRERVVDNDPTFQSILIREYHRSMIRLSERALDMLRGADRSINGFTVTVPRDKLPEVKRWTEDLLRDLFYKILSLQDTTDEVDGEIVQCNLQAFRLTDMTL